MNPSIIEKSHKAIHLEFNSEQLIVHLSDGRILSVPLEWFPRLRDAASEELSSWRLIGDGEGIHFDKLDEDISVEKLVV